MRRLSHRGSKLRHRKVADAQHSHIAVAPRLCRRPLHHIEQIIALLLIHECPGPLRSAGPAQIYDQVNITARNKKIGRTRFQKTKRHAEILNLPGIRRRGKKRRKSSPASIRLKQIGKQLRSITHADRDVICPLRVEFYFAKRPILAARSLQSIQATLAGLCARSFQIHWRAPQSCLGSGSEELIRNYSSPPSLLA